LFKAHFQPGGQVASHRGAVDPSWRGVDILRAQVHYICLMGVVGLGWVAIMGRGTRKVEKHCFKV